MDNINNYSFPAFSAHTSDIKADLMKAVSVFDTVNTSILDCVDI